MVNNDLEKLWKEYKDRGCTDAREQLITQYLSLVKYAAGRMVMNLPGSVEVDDLISYGTFGLLDAIEKFDYRRGIKFETYAYVRIKGAILDGLRALDWMPQTLRKKAREIERTYRELEARYGRSVTDEEVALELGVDKEEFDRLVMDISRSSVVSLDDFYYSDTDEEIPLRDMVADQGIPGPEAMVQFEEKKVLLGQAIDKLPDKEKLVVSLFYFDGLTVKEIAQVMELSSSRISQLHTKALLRLRSRLIKSRDALIS